MSKVKYIDQKVTIWQRFNFDEEVTKEQVIEFLKTNDLNSIQDNFKGYWEDLTDTAENLTVKENDGFATIEVHDDDHNIIHANGKH